MANHGNHNHTAGHGAVPIPTLRRLPGYLNYFRSLKINNVEYVSSSRIASVFKMDPTLVTKDLSYTGIRGRTKVGYNVDQLIESIISFLDFNTCEDAFLFGVGNLGRALINYEALNQYGLKIVAGFDVDPKVINTCLKDVNIYNLHDFRDISQKQKARIAIITTPESSAQEVADLVVAWGIKAIWNFTPQSIKVPDKIIIENTSVYADLAVLLNKLNN
ncbi:MAG: redox-sensing transcriptional repressor Rex [Bacteroidales bacterium]|nr:redox-sensing transcriptional repressor Rex [Bacteroidales bacterium]